MNLLLLGNSLGTMKDEEDCDGDCDDDMVY
jgi:hypothetical protein